MLARSAIPLIGLEDRCAIDSTGLRTTRFNYYRQEKYNPSRENAWLKMHALVGVKTHVIPVLEVTSGTVSDSPQFPVLLKRAIANGFHFKEVYADKGYQARDNFNAADQLEIVPFIPFKRNQTGKAGAAPCITRCSYSSSTSGRSSMSIMASGHKWSRHSARSSRSSGRP